MNDARSAPRAGLDLAGIDAVPALRADVETPEIAPVLPSDHPAWQRDVLSLSARARVALAALRPLAVRVLTFWDHRLRQIGLGGRTLRVDASGSYRLS